MLTLVDPGDDVLIVEPAWPHYAACVRLAGGRPIPVSTKATTGFVPDAGLVESLLNDRTKLLILNSPCNPTGAVYQRDLLRRLGELARQYGVLLVSDEMYERIVYSDDFVSTAAVDDNREITITLGGFSKGFAMTGWRLGYLAAPAPICSMLLRTHQYVTVCATSFAQDGGSCRLHARPRTLR